MQPVPDIQTIVEEFISKSKPTDRNASFDYCYNYFRKNKGKRLTDDMERTCLVLGFYLASWGMLRGSSFLLQKSIKHYALTIEYLANLDGSYWEIDVDNYSKNIDNISTLYTDLEKNLAEAEKTPSVILITKVMLGVFGIIPAYDTDFVKAFSQIESSKGKCSFTRVDEKSLDCLMEFYLANKGFIDKKSETTFTMSFETGNKTNIKYTKAKIIDMYGFTIGEAMSKNT